MSKIISSIGRIFGIGGDSGPQQSPVAPPPPPPIPQVPSPTNPAVAAAAANSTAGMYGRAANILTGPGGLTGPNDLLDQEKPNSGGYKPPLRAKSWLR